MRHLISKLITLSEYEHNAITNNANRELTSKSIETVSAFVDVDLEDEQQYYFKYYKEYFETSYGSTPDQKGL